MNRSIFEEISGRPSLKRAIRTRGGINRYGEPMYRLVWEPSRFQMLGGLYTEWPKDLPTKYRNPGSARSYRTIFEMRRVPMYDGTEKYRLERFREPEKFGTHDLWYSPEELGGCMLFHEGQWLPQLGAFPSRGDYEETPYSFAIEHVTEGNILRAIHRVETALAALPENPEQRARMQKNKEEEDERKKEADFDNFASEVMGDSNPFDVHSLGARAEVCREAERLGIRNHPF